MKKRVERARPDAIAVLREFFHHRQAEDRLVAGMQQYVNANQAIKKFPLGILHTKHYTPIHAILP